MLIRTNHGRWSWYGCLPIQCASQQSIATRKWEILKKEREDTTGEYEWNLGFFFREKLNIGKGHSGIKILWFVCTAWTNKTEQMGGEAGICFCYSRYWEIGKQKDLDKEGVGNGWCSCVGFIGCVVFVLMESRDVPVDEVTALDWRWVKL